MTRNVCRCLAVRNHPHRFFSHHHQRPPRCSSGLLRRASGYPAKWHSLLYYQSRTRGLHNDHLRICTRKGDRGSINHFAAVSARQDAMTKFGDFKPLCADTPSYPWCNLFYRQVRPDYCCETPYRNLNKSYSSYTITTQTYSTPPPTPPPPLA